VRLGVGWRVEWGSVGGVQYVKCGAIGIGCWVIEVTVRDECRGKYNYYYGRNK
jgi:hypothetical protein